MVYELKYITQEMIDVKETLGRKLKIYVEIYFILTKCRIEKERERERERE